MIDKNSQEWYSNALEALSPFRFLMFQVIEQIETHNRFQRACGYPEIKSKYIDDAKAAMDAANEFFSSGK